MYIYSYVATQPSCKARIQLDLNSLPTIHKFHKLYMCAY